MWTVARSHILLLALVLALAAAGAAGSGIAASQGAPLPGLMIGKGPWGPSGSDGGDIAQELAAAFAHGACISRSSGLAATSERMVR